MSRPVPSPSSKRAKRRVLYAVSAILLGGAVTGLSIRSGSASPEAIGALAPPSTSTPTEGAARFTPDWWESGDASCPEGARLVGGVPPDGFEVWCERADRSRHGAHVRWHRDGRRAFFGRYESGVLEGTAIEWFPNGRRWREIVYERGQRRAWTRWTEDGVVAEHVP